MRWAVATCSRSSHIIVDISRILWLQATLPLEVSLICQYEQEPSLLLRYTQQRRAPAGSNRQPRMVSLQTKRLAHHYS